MPHQRLQNFDTDQSGAGAWHDVYRILDGYRDVRLRAHMRLP